MIEEHTLLNHYNLATPYPVVWPAEKDQSDASEEDLSSKKLNTRNLRRSKSRYSALEGSRNSRRSLVPGSEKTGDGVENLVQKDEADPLGGPDSVVQVLRQTGIGIEEDQRLRNRFLLSSTTFSPTLYLSQIHSDSSTQTLLQGLEYLSHSIDQKSASLKILVESNFERFVRAKTTIDNVYAEMRDQGAEFEVEKPKAHSRVGSKGSAHFRSPSGQASSTLNWGVNKPLPSDKKKHALTKESEYGVQGIKGPLIEVAVKAEEIWGPALGGREKEEGLRLALDSLEKCRGIFNAGSAISDCIKRKDYDTLVDEYSRARKYADEARGIANNAINNQSPLTEPQVNQIVITARMWSEVENGINNFKRGLWRKLTDAQATPRTGRGPQEEYMVLIGILLELGVDDNPIWVWLLSRYDYLKTKIRTTFQRSRVEIEVLRRRLANAEKPTPQVVALHLKTSARPLPNENPNELDTPPVIELWDLILTSMDNLLSARRGILAEVIDFWDKVQMFMDGKAQKMLPVGIDGRSRAHHRLSTDGSRQLQDGVTELIEMLRENVFSFFADPPLEDISMLYSPLPPTTPNTPMSAARSPFPYQDSRFKFDANNPPPPSSRQGEIWDEFAFWPPYANALSGVYYLDKLLTLLGGAAAEMLGIRSAASGSALSEKLKTMIAGTRERATRAVCAAWDRDAEACKALENWTHSGEKRDLTSMPGYLHSFETTVLSGLQRILYIPDMAPPGPGSITLVSPPPSKLLQVVRSQFVTTLYKVLSGMVENAEKPVNYNGADWAAESQANYELTGTVLGGPVDRKRVNVESRSVRLLLTLSNLKALQTEIIPNLVHQFETDFSVSLSDESKSIRDVLAKIDSKVSHSYTRPIADQLSSLILTAIASPAWTPRTPHPTQVRPYVHQALLRLVAIHAEVSTTAAPLTAPILSHLLEHISLAFLAAFRARATFSLPALMQATLDVEFTAQTMSAYTTERASQIQSDIYVELDRCTEPEARIESQTELLQIGVMLKKLREGTRGQFACFKNPRGGRER